MRKLTKLKRNLAKKGTQIRKGARIVGERVDRVRRYGQREAEYVIGQGKMAYTGIKSDIKETGFKGSTKPYTIKIGKKKKKINPKNFNIGYY